MVHLALLMDICVHTHTHTHTTDTFMRPHTEEAAVKLLNKLPKNFTSFPPPNMVIFYLIFVFRTRDILSLSNYKQKS